MGHKHSVHDSETQHFSIDPLSRVITNQSSKTVIMQYDHNSERFTFEMPRYIEKHDMLECNQIQVHYINIGGNGSRVKGMYPVTDIEVSATDDNVLVFTWLISDNATSLVGTLSFVVRFACLTDDKLDYAWHTAVHSGISIGTSIRNTEEIATQYADILVQWYNELLGWGGKVAAEVAAEMAPALEAEIEAEKLAAIEAIKVQADEIVNLVLERMPQAEDQVLGTIPQAEEASF